MDPVKVQLAIAIIGVVLTVITTVLAILEYVDNKRK
jgi:hypothetical protein